MSWRNEGHVVDDGSRCQGRTVVEECPGVSWQQLRGAERELELEWIRRLKDTVDPSFFNYKNCGIALIPNCSYVTAL